jgi:hypothetical protein
MSWLKANLNVGHILILVTLAVGFIGSQAVDAFSGDLLTEAVAENTEEIELNSDFRKEGFPFTHEKEVELATSLNHATSDDVHMPMAEKIKVFVPRTEFEDVKSDIKELKEGQKQILEILLAQ